MNDASYNRWVSMSDKAHLETIGRFIKHHRLNQNKSQTEVSEAAGISRSTLSLLERGETVNLNTLLQVLRALDLLYLMEAFKVTDEISPLEYAKLKKNQRKHASGKKAGKDETEDLGW